MYLNVDFIASSLVGVVGGVASAVVLAGFSWWAPLVLLLALGLDPLAAAGERRLEGPQHQRGPARPNATRTTPTGSPWIPQPAKELRLFGLAGLGGRASSSPGGGRCSTCSTAATRLRERPVRACAWWSSRPRTLAVFGALGFAATSGRLPLEELVVYAQVALGVSLVAFGGLNWALDGAAAPVAAVDRLGPAMAPRGALVVGRRARRAAGRAREVVLREVCLRLSRHRSAGLLRTRPDGPGRHRRWPSSARTVPARPPWPSCSAGSTTPTRA